MQDDNVIELDIQPDAVNDKFFPYLLSRARYRLFWGGRSSSKSDMACLDLLVQCLTLPYFKCLMIRKVADTIQGSIWATLKDVAEREGLDHLFFFGTSPLVIKCLINKNSFLGRGLDAPKKIKSTREPTHAIYEEANETTQSEFEVVSTTLRSSRPGALVQEIFLFNPDQDGDYKEFWLWQKFFRDTGHPDGTTFSGTLSTEIDGEIVEESYEVLHSTIRDNRWASREEIARYKRYGDINPETNEAFDAYRYRIWYEGLWAQRLTGNEFYHRFSQARHVKSTPYLQGIAIYTGWDANSLPYSAMICAQLQRGDSGLVVRLFKEYTLGPPESGVRPTAKQFLKDRIANGWQESSVMLTGDASMKNKKPGEGSATLYKDIEAELNAGRALNGGSDRWLRQNPNVDRRRDFINLIFSGFYSDLAIQIDPSLTLTIADLEQVQKGVDGKHKQRVLDKELGVSYEPIGHLSDVLDYLVVTLLPDRWEAFVKGYKR